MYHRNMSLVRQVRLRVPAGSAKPGPAIGQALGPLGINMMEFCKKFNEETKNIVQDTPMPVVSSELCLTYMRGHSFVVMVAVLAAT